MKYFITTIVFFLLYGVQNVNSQISILNIKFENKYYDELVFRMSMGRDENVYINGKSADGSDWVFTIPDSLLNKMEWADLYSHYSDSLVSNLIIKYILGKDTLLIGSMGGIKKNGTLNLTYMESKFTENVQPYNNRVYHSDVFLVEELDFEFYADVLIRKQHKILSRQGIIDLMVKLVKEHPESFAMMTYIYSWRNNYKLTKPELQTFYQYFNEAAQNSYWGRKLYVFLTTEVPDNPTLKNLATREPELLIMDRSKYNLVIFSASWCGYCHQQIPLLKEIYADLHNKGLEITYVTTDRASAIETWNKVTKEYELPWRSLWTEDATAQITFKFGVYSYPHSILFNPDGTCEKIDVRKSSDKEKLYDLLNRNGVFQR